MTPLRSIVPLNTEEISVATLSAKAEEQIKYMMLVLVGKTISPHVNIGQAHNGCKVVFAKVDEIGCCKLMEQNSKTKTVFAQAAKEGVQLAWLMGVDGGYLGPLLYIDALGKPQITTGPEWKTAVGGGGI